MKKTECLIFAMAFLIVSIAFSSYSGVLQVSCWITGVGFLIKHLTTK